MLHLQIDVHSGVPVYRQVMDQIKYYAASGVLKAGDQIPSIRDLARSLSVNPTTVVKAYNELEHEGVIELQHGKGAFVTGTIDRMTDAARREALRRLGRQIAVEATQMAAPLDLVLDLVREEMEVMRRERDGD